MTISFDDAMQKIYNASGDRAVEAMVYLIAGSILAGTTRELLSYNEVFAERQLDAINDAERERRARLN
jgi:hypothetical protein